MTKLTRADSGPLYAFVRSAWTLLAFQLLVAAIAVGVTGWAAFQVRPLLEERNRLELAIGQAEDRIVKLAEAEQEATLLVKSLEERATMLRDELKGARAATPILTKAIRAFHDKDYALAIVNYDEALRLDPNDAYIHNLRSYSQFKAGDYEGAIQSLSRALELNPAYGWGYFDLARYQCAADSPDAALATIVGALAERGEGIRRMTKFFLAEDGEFRRLCGRIREELQEITGSSAN